MAAPRSGFLSRRTPVIDNTNPTHSPAAMAAKYAARAKPARPAPQPPKMTRFGLLWLLVPKIPMFLGVFFSRVFGISETARYLSLSTEMTLTVLRSLVGGMILSIGRTQAMTLSDPGVKGRIWVSNAVSEVPPQRGLREALFDAIVSLGGLSAYQAEAVHIPAIVPVEAEWTGYRAGVAKSASLPVMSEVLKYEALMKECKNNTTVLYFHGGAYYLCDPSSHRQLTRRLAKLTGGRVYSVRYRLAPQNPFPAALLDALVSYFTLLYPPPGSMHEAVLPQNIVFGGDSAGGNLALVLTRTLMYLQQEGKRVMWFGVEREVPLPAGVTLFSPWLDITLSLPSWTTNQKWDYLPPPEILDLEKTPPPPDHVWPTTPARKRIFVDDALALHPLVSAHLNRSWAGAPPIWISCGWECLADENKYFVSRLRADGVPVVFEEFEAMPHVFAAVLPKLEESKRCLRNWARFVAAVRKDPASVKSRYIYFEAKTLREREGDAENLTPYNQYDVFDLAYAKLGKDAPSLASVDSRF